MMPRIYQMGLAVALMTVILVPLPLLVTQRFHQDEALYSTWALEIGRGGKPGLAGVPVDKPPLFLYAAAGSMALFGPTETAARLPSLLASLATVALTFALGRRLYGPAVGLLGAGLVALSPLTLMFAPTALTDPLMVAFALGASVAAVHRRGWLAGLLLGCAVATKQPGVFFGPLVVGALQVAGSKEQVRFGGWSSPQGGEGAGETAPSGGGERQSNPGGKEVLRMGLAAAVILLLLTLWDWRRGGPSFWRQSVLNYGGVSLDLAGAWERGRGFVELLGYASAWPALHGIFLLGLPLLLARREARDWLLAGFAAAYLLVHAGLSFQVWDRYVLGLVPILALLAARLVTEGAGLLTARLDGRGRRLLNRGLGGIVGVGLAVTLVVTAGRVGQGQYPLGSNSRGLAGIEQVTAYLQGHVGADNTLYHRWLGPHWRFYLWGYPYDLRYWASPAALAEAAAPGHWIAFPAWRSETAARLALGEAGLGLQEVHRAYRPDGAPSLILYRIVEL